MSGAGSVTISDAELVLEPDSNVEPRLSDPSRLRDMMKAHFSFIWRSLERLGVPPADVDDCAQQVFLVASRKLASIALGSEQAFLFGTALHVAAEARRSFARRRDVTTDTIEALDPAPRPDELLDRARARELLDQVLNAMPMDLRAAFVLYELEEMPIHTIAAFLNIPTGTAASRLRRARAEFQRLCTKLQRLGALHGAKR